jgi:hypothetical protein
VAPDHPDPDRPEGRLVGARVHVDCLELPDLLAAGVDDVVLTPVADVFSLEHALELPFSGLPKR